MNIIRLLKQILSISFLTLLTACGNDGHSPLPPIPQPEPQPEKERIDIIGVWRCYYTTPENTLEGWTEFNFHDDGSFILYDYYTHNDSLGINRGFATTYIDGMEIQWDGTEQTENYKYTIDEEKFIIPANPDEYYYNILPEELNMVGAWETFNSNNGKIMQIDLSKYRIKFTSLLPNGTTASDQGNYNAQSHEMQIWWASQMSTGENPDFWYYAVDGNEMYNSCAGGTAWKRKGTNKTTRTIKQRKKCCKNGKQRFFARKK